MNKRRTVFFVSDQTGVTAETMGHSLLTQFDGLDFRPVTLPFIINVDKAHEALAKINSAASEEGVRPIVFATFVNDEVREIVRLANCSYFDFFDTFLGPLEQEFGQPSTHAQGRAHGMTDIAAYTMRINATNFALANDDGVQTREYGVADVVLVGVSRSGKTPTCVYMALQYGTFAANYPLTDEDLDGRSLPSAIATAPTQAVRPDHPARPPAADPPGTPARQPLCLDAAVHLGGPRGRAIVRASRHSLPGDDRLFDRGNCQPRYWSAWRYRVASGPDRIRDQ